MNNLLNLCFSIMCAYGAIAFAISKTLDQAICGSLAMFICGVCLAININFPLFKDKKNV